MVTSKKHNTSKKHKKPQVSPTTSSIHGLEDSKLLQLPQEIRDLVFEHLFRSTRISSGRRTFGRIDHRRIVSASKGNALSILRSCHRIHKEIGNSWLSQVLFHFETPDAMLNKLANIPIGVRNQIRHARVSGDPLMISFDEDDIFYRTAQALKLLPRLNLDVLTVLGNRVAEVAYDTLGMLISHGTGWKELRYIAHNSKFLGYYTLGKHERYLRQPQPSSWQSILEDRDGLSTSPSVMIYRTKQAHNGDRGPSREVFLPEQRTELKQVFAPGQNTRNYGKVEDASLMQPSERGKEVLVVVKRGTGVDYVEKEGAPFLRMGDIREELPGQTWKQINAEQDARFRDEDDDESDSENDFTPTFADAYSHVDEYTWPRLHFSSNRLRRPGVGGGCFCL